MKNKQQVQELKNICEKIVSYNIELIANNPDHGSFGFQEAKEVLQQLQDFFREILDADLYKIPSKSLESLKSTASEVSSKFGEVSSYNLKDAGNNAASQRSNILASLEVLWNRIHNDHSHTWNFLFREKIDLAGQKRRVNELVLNATSQVNQALEMISKKTEEITEAVQVAKETAASAGVSLHTTDYKNAVDASRKTATYWLVASAVSLLVLILYICSNVYDLHQISESFVNSSLTLKKEQIDGLIRTLYISAAVRLGILTVLLVISKTLFTQYRSYLHIARLNEESSLALGTFKAFHQGAHSTEIKDAVLIGAAGLIFSHRPTGFSDKDTSSQELNSVIEMAGKLKGK